MQFIHFDTPNPMLYLSRKRKEAPSTEDIDSGKVAKRRKRRRNFSKNPERNGNNQNCQPATISLNSRVKQSDSMYIPIHTS